ncbi:YbjQ family protein [Pararhodonellum marinum]|uniref:hypothetical protein n=1 Tax=Pararhodonellum marinum TaxID=2755358 RepID=UPI00188DE4AE|nr:hypothetical protein [Pararhodonellum marinum]
MKKHLPFLFGFLILAIFASCTSTMSLSGLEDSYEGMEIYTAKVPDRSFRELNFIEVRSGWPMDANRLMDRLVKRAKDEGADGLINVRLTSLERSFTISGTAVKFEDSIPKETGAVLNP